MPGETPQTVYLNSQGSEGTMGPNYLTEQNPNGENLFSIQDTSTGLL